MDTREILTKRWDDMELVTSPVFGTVEEVFVQPKKSIDESDPLFIIRNELGALEQITVGISGVIESINVKKGDNIVQGMVLASIKEDSLAPGHL